MGVCEVLLPVLIDAVGEAVMVLLCELVGELDGEAVRVVIVDAGDGPGGFAVQKNASHDGTDGALLKS